MPCSDSANDLRGGEAAAGRLGRPERCVVIEGNVTPATGVPASGSRSPSVVDDPTSPRSRATA
ncbi:MULTISPECIES: hypothetical protein [Saccharothrix]|uniref:hypothetical protein n=1 Tax=Saccharothrix TaxID=2071 RepID=UPI00096606BB|nr:hypothetical protein [Saccharothrix sp. CB00851]OKI16202.1 hypothetical protein A6A25_13030 [Saccharothrix sp. CB00851]